MSMEMEQLRDRKLISRYVNQFGPVRSTGKEHLKRIVEYYVDHDFTLQFSHPFKQMDGQQGYDSKTSSKAISRFLSQAWDKGFDWAWRRYLGWDQPKPPRPAEAVQLLCENYASFVLTFHDVLARTPAWYIRLAVEELDSHQGN